jgi:predicted molibdopterin-dependent oxidoreductase YjgC
MFKRLHDIDEDRVTITIEDQQLEVSTGDTVAAAMLTAGIEYARTTPISGAHRAPYCLMGACFECLVEIDSVPNQQACQTQVREGMTVKLQQGARDIES